MAARTLPGLGLSITLAFVLFTVATTADASGKTVVNGAAAVKEWCEKKSFKHFRKKKLIPYNWTASWWDEGNTIVVKGEWRVEQGRALVTCSAIRGEGLSGAVMEVSDGE